MRDLETWLTEVYGAAGNRETLKRLYDEWSQQYDADLWASGNPYIAITAAMVGRHIPDLNARILDGGCGTGLLGHVLHQTGYRNVVGLDPSPGMLNVARSKGCYAELHELPLQSNIALEDASFDAVVAAGVLTHGHAPPESLDGMVRVAKPGAPIIFSISRIAMQEDGFGEKLKQLEKDGTWALIERSATFRTYPFLEAQKQLRHWVIVYRTLAAG